MQDLAGFDDDAMRVELGRIVERAKSDILRKFDAAEVQFDRDAQVTPRVSEEFRTNFHEKFADSRLLLQRRFQAMLDFIDRR